MESNIKANEIIEGLCAIVNYFDHTHSVDRLYSGDPDLDVKYFECGEVCTYTDD